MVGLVHMIPGAEVHATSQLHILVQLQSLKNDRRADGSTDVRARI